MDPVAVAEAVAVAVDRAREGEGPTFLEMKTYRYKGHSMSDAQKYRTKDEVAEYQKIDPIKKVLEIIKNKKWATEDEITEIQANVKATVQEAVDFAEESPFPSNDSLYKNVYAEEYPFIKN
jgi:pyruvate dehydrogenase E1 component alpha subunit